MNAQKEHLAFLRDLLNRVQSEDLQTYSTLTYYSNPQQSSEQSDQFEVDSGDFLQQIEEDEREAMLESGLTLEELRAKEEILFSIGDI